MATTATLPQDTREAANRLFSLGYIAKGIVYVLMGGLTLTTALGFAGGIEGPRGIIQWVVEQPLGRILVGLLGLGLASYCLWRLYRAITDPTREGSDGEGVVKRIGFAVSGLVYGSLAVLAFRLALGMGGGGGGSKEGIIARLLQQSWGQWAVGAIALIVAGVGALQVYKGVKGKFVEDFRWEGVPTAYVRTAGKWGHIARGIVFGIIAYFLLLTAVNANSNQFRGIEGALEYLGEYSYGVVLLCLAGVGFMLYGYFAYVKGRYGRVA